MPSLRHGRPQSSDARLSQPMLGHEDVGYHVQDLSFCVQIPSLPWLYWASQGTTFPTPPCPRFPSGFIQWEALTKDGRQETNSPSISALSVAVDSGQYLWPTKTEHPPWSQLLLGGPAMAPNPSRLGF